MVSAGATSGPGIEADEALLCLLDGHYLNLPVVDEEGSLVGIVDVLKLTYATLEQVRQELGEPRGRLLTCCTGQLHHS